MEQRLQKLLAAAGIGSRRSCESLIAEGRVTVNGARVRELGVKADPGVDDVRLDGKPIASAAPHLYIALNKPIGYVSTVRDPHAEHTVMELVGSVGARIYPVGRLDADSAGLLLLTNDGDFAQRLTHPSHQVSKTYRAVVRGLVPEYAGADLRKGVLLDDGMTAPASVEWVDYDERNNASIIDVTIHEGRNRQVRRMFDVIGYPVLALTRLRIGPVELKGIAPGTWRKLRPDEVQALVASADATQPVLPQTPPDEPAPVATAPPRPAGTGRPATTERSNFRDDRGRVSSRRNRGERVEPRATEATADRTALPTRQDRGSQRGPHRAAAHAHADRDAALRAAAEELTAKLQADDAADRRAGAPGRPTSQGGAARGHSGQPDRVDRPDARGAMRRPHGSPRDSRRPH